MYLSWVTSCLAILIFIFHSDYALAFDDTCGCKGSILYNDYTEACDILQSQSINNATDYKILYYTDRGCDVVDLTDTRLRCDSDILIFVGNPGQRSTDQKFLDGFINGCQEKDELVFRLLWGLTCDIDDCGDLQAAAINAGHYLLGAINQMINLGADIGDIRIVTLGSGFSVASVAANEIAKCPNRDCLKYVAGVQPTETGLAVSSVSCKTIALFDNPGDCAILVPQATVNIIFANSNCDEENPDCLLSIPNLSKIISIFNNNLILYKSASWQDALAGKSFVNKIKIAIEALSSGFYITDPNCKSGNVNANTIENRNNRITVNTGPFNAFCGCSPFDWNAEKQFCSVRPNIQNATALLLENGYFLKHYRITNRCDVLSIDECPNFLTNQNTIIVVGDAIDDTADDFGNAANQNFYYSAHSHFARGRNFISFYWTYNDKISSCQDLSERIQEAGVYLYLYLRKFDSCNSHYSQQNFISYGNGVKILEIALSLLPTKVGNVVGIRPTNFPIDFGDYATRLALFHQKPGTCSSWTTSGPVSIIVNDPALPCSDATCNYGNSLVDFTYLALTRGFTVFKSDSWTDAIAGIAANTPIHVDRVDNMTNGFYITNILNTCPAVSADASKGQSPALINLNLDLLNDLL